MSDRQQGVPAFDGWAPFYDLADRDVGPFIAFYSGLVRSSTRSVLDLGCGTGTITIALAGLLDHDVPSARLVGVDESRQMLDIARARDGRIDWILGDMRAPPVDGTFDLVVCCYNTLQLLLRDADLGQAFRTAQRLLSPDGIFAFDVYQPNLEWLSCEATNVLARSITYNRRHLEVREDRSYDPAARVLTTVWRLVEAGKPPDQLLARTVFDMRQYSREEIDRLLSAAGLTVKERYGDLDRSAFDTTAKRQVLVCSLA